MEYVRNAAEIARTPLREDIVEILEAGIAAIDTDRVLREHVHLNGSILTVRDRSYDLASYERVFIVGCGKVACQAAAVVEDIVRLYVKGGAVVGLTPHACEVVTTYQGTHPLPTEVNFAASRHIVQISEQVTDRDFVISIVGGGGSALMCSSQGECDQGSQLYDAFLNAGGTIEELNTVRKHISTLKGGGLAQALHPATIVSLIFSDVPGGDLSVVASGPTYKDTSTIADAQMIIDKYHLGQFVLIETPKSDAYFERVDNVMMVSNQSALQAMADRAQQLEYAPIFSRCDPYAPAADMVDTMLAEVQGRCAVLLGGEARIAVPTGVHGTGGRNSHLALLALDYLKDGQVFGSLATDGHDNSDSAGAIVDKATRQRLIDQGVDIVEYRNRLDSGTLLKGTGDLIDTGHLESNVSDLMVILSIT